MAFDLILYTQFSELNRIDKELEELGTYTGVLREETSIIDPVIVLEIDAASIATANYVYIEDFKRYYFINGITSVRNNLTEISCHVDVLMSFSNAIKEQTAIIARQEIGWNLYLDDGTLKTYSNPMVLAKAFPSGFNTQSFVLCVAGS